MLSQYAQACLGSGILLPWKWLMQDAEEAKQPGGNLFHLIIGQLYAEFVLVDRSKLLDCLAAQLLWCFHALTLRVTASGLETLEAAGDGRCTTGQISKSML